MPFSRTERPSSVQRCINKCRAAKQADDQLSVAVQKRIQSLTGKAEPATGRLPTDGSPVLMSATSNDCKRRAATLGPTLRRFNRYREALPYAGAASDMNKLGDDPKPPKTDEPKQPDGPCVTRLPVNAAALCRALGLPPGTITDEELRNDKTGFRAAMYRDEATGKLILVPRDTQPNSLVDWQTNTRNGDGKDTDQYAAVRKLSKRLKDNHIVFDVAGYSKGGGLAQEAALINRSSKAFLFNSAGLPEAALARTGNTEFTSLETRTKLYSAQDDFLTYMNDTKDSDQQIKNVKYLIGELKGENRYLIDPMLIDYRNPEHNKKDAFLKTDLVKYFKELDAKVAKMDADRAKGIAINALPPVRAGEREILPGRSLNSHIAGPNLGKLAQHQMKNVLLPMENKCSEDRELLVAFLTHCG